MLSWGRSAEEKQARQPSLSKAKRKQSPSSRVDTIEPSSNYSSITPSYGRPDEEEDLPSAPKPASDLPVIFHSLSCSNL